MSILLLTVPSTLLYQGLAGRWLPVRSEQMNRLMSIGDSQRQEEAPRVEAKLDELGIRHERAVQGGGLRKGMLWLMVEEGRAEEAMRAMCAVLGLAYDPHDAR
jgi:hypothetical protein